LIRRAVINRQRIKVIFAQAVIYDLYREALVVLMAEKKERPGKRVRIFHRSR
jgi:hypothetical protein